MKPGDIVRYSAYPHYELHMSGMTGLVLSEPRVQEDQYGDLVSVDVMWNSDRGLLYPAGTITWEYVDELEVIQ